MLFWKIVVPFLTLFSAIIQIQFKDKWHDRASKKHRFYKIVLYGIMLIGTIFTILTIIDDHKHSLNMENSLSSLSKNFTEDRSVLRGKIDTLELLLRPFTELAKNRFPDLNTTIALGQLAKEISDQKEYLNIQKQYYEVAKLNLIGKSGQFGFGFIETSAISKYFEGTYKIENNHIQFLCSDLAITKYLQTISKFPDFPFSYYAMAYCLMNKNDTAWRNYARKAVTILNNTTKVPGHHPNHDDIKKELSQALSQ